MGDVEHEWVNDEYEDAELGDRRRSNRLVLMAQAMAESPATSFPKVFTEDADLEGAYRFFNNRRISPESILRPHVMRTIERVGDSDAVLAIHDSTLMAYRAGGKRKGLHSLRKGEQEFLAHVTLAVSAEGARQPLGVLGLSGQKKERRNGRKPTIHRKDKSEFPSDYDRWLERIQDVESLPFKEGQLIHVADREADDYELLGEIIALGSRFVIRSSHNRRLAPDVHEEEKLHDVLASAEVVAKRSILISSRLGNERGPDSLKAHPAREGRKAEVEILKAKATIKRPECPKTEGLEEGIEINLVHVREPQPPEGQPAVDWLLLTTEAIASVEDVERVVDIYRTRWLIEEYFKALKSGCSYEKRQLSTLHALTNALALFAPIAWRQLLMRSAAQEHQDAPASTVFTQDELFVLKAKARKRCLLPENPTVRDAFLSIAALGGHLKRNGPPGWKTLNSGYEDFMKWMIGFYLAKNSSEI
jgi:hypothetical protein